MQKNVLKVIDFYNQKLTKIKIRQRKKSLYLRGTLPPKPGTGDVLPKQYELSTKLPATEEGVKLAFAKAQAIESDLLFERFSWSDYLGSGVSTMTIGQWIDLFVKDFWQKNPFTLNKQIYLKKIYLTQFDKLNHDENLDIDKIIKQLEQIGEPDSSARFCFFRAVYSLCKFAGLPLDRLKRPRYKPKIKRDIPSDKEIEIMREELNSVEKKWLFSMLAIYGLRPHELFHIKEIETIFLYPHYIKIGQDAKSKKERVVFPSNPEWLQKWDIFTGASMPLLSPTNLSNLELGSRIGKHIFYNTGITAYYLRDAYAIRCARQGIPDSICADWMGHGLAVHHERYLVHINVDHYTLTWEKFMSPKVP